MKHNYKQIAQSCTYMYTRYLLTAACPDPSVNKSSKGKMTGFMACIGNLKAKNT